MASLLPVDFNLDNLLFIRVHTSLSINNRNIIMGDFYELSTSLHKPHTKSTT